MTTPSQPGSWPPPNDPSNPYAAAPGGSGYGAPGPGGGPGYPGPYGSGGPPAAKPTRPGAVTGSFLIWVLGAIVSVVTLIVVLNSAIWDQAVAEAIRQGGETTNGVSAQQLVNAARGVAIAVFAIFALLYVFFAVMMFLGRNWARIVLTVLGALGIISSFTPTTSSVTVNGTTYTSGSQTYGYIGGILTIIAIVLMYLPAANAYFRESKAYRQAAKYR